MEVWAWRRATQKTLSLRRINTRFDLLGEERKAECGSELLSLSTPEASNVRLI